MATTLVLLISVVLNSVAQTNGMSEGMVSQMMAIRDSAKIQSKSGESMGFIIFRGSQEQASKNQMIKYFEGIFKRDGVNAKIFFRQQREGEGEISGYQVYLKDADVFGLMIIEELKKNFPTIVNAQKGYTLKYHAEQARMKQRGGH